jgi:hypothetical protein
LRRQLETHFHLNQIRQTSGCLSLMNGVFRGNAAATIAPETKA